MTLYALAIMACEAFNLDTSQIRPISNASLPGLAPRPIDTAFDLVRLTNELRVSPMGPTEGLAVFRDTEIGHGVLVVYAVPTPSGIRDDSCI
jgi:hypothetical protein